MLISRDPSTAEQTTVDPADAGPVVRRARIVGVDVARGAALLGMMAVHVLDSFDAQDAPTATTLVAAGRSAATFALVAGVSVALLSGGRHVVRGSERTAVAGGLVVRALLIGAIGLALGALAESNGVDGILPFYAVLFLLAVPLLACPPAVLAGLAAAVAVVGPVLLVATAGLPLPDPDSDPTFTALVQDPLAVVAQLFLTGSYPVVVYLAYLCAGLAIGRLDLTARRVAWWLFGGGVALAVVARLASVLLLYPLGGFAVLISGSSPGGTAAETARTLLWDPDPATSWWYLALPAPHSESTVDLVHTLACAVAVLGAALLLTRSRIPARLLSPLAAAGSMALTLYSAHLVLLATGVLEDEPVVLFGLMVVGAGAFAVVWRRLLGQGPLERVVAILAGATRRRLAERLPRRPGGPAADRGAAARVAQFVVPVACAAVVALALVLVARPAPEPQEVATAETLAAPPPDPAPAAVAEPGPEPDLDRYCLLSEQVDAADDRHPDDPVAFVGEARGPLVDMPRVAPAEIRDAVAVSVADTLAEVGDTQAQAPDEGAVDQAEELIDAYEEANCP
ncbi:heparan-alpha-glucosaminide N-acetyltransferase domain-containing protein [Pseudonocardia sp. MH-G8]|uniref:heparan-alpha-glucosaminide N-acetyltransferase domain-containing protein n=1 Tax=Pseudonocardia sp. MH-G8 TaxID=1854588 RepID=UPI000BA06DB5|nr:heparan-alpha-glucosaminide N-acetyltransferase domain-containing protein [Pseudonocardia sp. MH-G8]OZM79352.1 hypothetical protein CFP66_26805 [Pseudonocardia sp. MH-G8]